MAKLVLPTLRADQYAMAMHPARRKNAAMGRRYGKTTTCGVLAANIVRQHGRSAWVVPTYKNSRAPWRWLVQVFAPLVTAKRAEISKTDKVITTDMGGFLAIYSADNIDAIRGEWFHLVVNDECALIGEDAITDAIEPTLADADGEMINISTPKGRNWFFRSFQRGLSLMNEDEASWTAPTTANPNPNIQKAARLAKERMSDRTYRQEWLAEFIDDAGGVFRGVRGRATLAPQQPRPGQYVFGVDWGKSNDSTVISVIDVVRRQQVTMDRFNQIDYAVQRQRLMALYEAWRPVTILAEANSIGTPIIEQLQRDGLPVQPFVTSNASKAQIIEGLALAFERAQITLLDDATQTMELESYEMTRTATGQPKYGAPSGLHDDTVIALALSYHAAYGYGEAGI